ncbi:MAG: hypothetical protein IJF56_10210 [Clostridia bacterium]|nr:hypothetical protein [Clostridia bacterium]
MEKNHPYADILDAPRPVFPHRRHMSMVERGAQFSPFAALTGYDDTIQETARLTDIEIELDPESLEKLNAQLRWLAAQVHLQPEIRVTSFEPDEKKAGGSYCSRIVSARKIDPVRQVLITADREEIPMERILALDGPIFELME